MFKQAASPDEFYGSYLVGYLPRGTTYQLLVGTFGEPTERGSPDGKTQVTWLLEFADGTRATVYDYKEGVPPEQVADWHVGGFGREAFINVQRTLSSAMASSTP